MRMHLLLIIKKIGWKINQPCFYKINLSNDIPKNILTFLLKSLIIKKLKYFRNYINIIFLNENLDDLNVAIITPDKDIIPDAKFDPRICSF